MQQHLIDKNAHMQIKCNLKKLFLIYDFRLHHDKIPKAVLLNDYNLINYHKHKEWSTFIKRLHCHLATQQLFFLLNFFVYVLAMGFEPATFNSESIFYKYLNITKRSRKC